MIILNDIKYKDKPVRVIFEHYRIDIENVVDKHKGPPKTAWMKRYCKDKHPFKPQSRGGRTIAILCNTENDKCKLDDVLAIGQANCSMSDQFNYARGRKIALGRALEELRKTYGTT